jgi:hypothetical protein
LRTGPREMVQSGELASACFLACRSRGRVRGSGGSSVVSGCPGSHDNDKREAPEGRGLGVGFVGRKGSGHIEGTAREESSGSSPGRAAVVSCSLVASRTQARVRAVPGPSDNDNAGHQAYEDEGTESEWLAQDSKSHEGSSVGQPRGASLFHPPSRAWGAPWFIAGRSENSWSQSDTWPWGAYAKVRGGASP